MVLFPNYSVDVSMSVDASPREAEKSGLKRSNGLRARSVPYRYGKRMSVASGAEIRSEDMHHSRHAAVAPALVRNRSASCPHFNVFPSKIEWKDIVASGIVPHTESNIGAVAPILDIRHSCVKSESPTLVHQDEGEPVTPMSAEVIIPEGVVLSEVGAPAHLLVGSSDEQYAREQETIHASGISRTANVAPRPLLSVNIPPAANCSRIVLETLAVTITHRH